VSNIIASLPTFISHLGLATWNTGNRTSIGLAMALRLSG